MLADVLGCLICPNCGAGLADAGGAVRCANGHAFDVARQGYVNLLPGGARTGTADTAEMVEARDWFLGTGCYEPIARAVARAATGSGAGDVAGCVVDVGAGTGYYLAAVLEALPEHDGLALDLSKYAARRAARAHPRIGAAVCDTWKALPVREGSAALVLDVFAPRNPAEFARILGRDGVLVVVTPTTDHLRELVTSLGLLTVDEDKPARLEAALGERFEAAHRTEVTEAMSLTRDEVAALVGMGPSAWHADDEDLDAGIDALPEPLLVTLSVVVSAFRARG